MAEQWKHILENLVKMVDPADFKVWIAPLSAEITGHTLVLTLIGASDYMVHRLEKKMGQVIRASASEVLTCHPDDVHLKILSTAQTSRPAPALPAVPDQKVSLGPKELVRVPSQGVAKGGVRLVQGELLGQAPLNQPLTASCNVLLNKLGRFSFEDFVVGPTNEMAAVAARDVCRAGGCVETLFVSSAAGLGKTHIAQSVARQLVQERGVAARVAYLTAEDFYARFRQGLRGNSLDDFTARIKALDFLLLDDVQFLHGKLKTQELLLSLVKHLQNRGSRVVFTSQFQPRDLTILDAQLVSLLSSGILTNMGLPTFEMRKEMLRRKAKVHQVILPDEVTDLLASRLTGDIRQLESCLQTLLLKMRILRAPLTPEMAMEVLNEFMPQGNAAQPTFDDILHFVSESFGLTIQQIGSKVRRREFVTARNTLFYLARKHTTMTLDQIGSRLNKRHSTVIKGISAVEHEISSESSLGRQMSRVINLIERNAGMGAQSASS